MSDNQVPLPNGWPDQQQLSEPVRQLLAVIGGLLTLTGSIPPDQWMKIAAYIQGNYGIVVQLVGTIIWVGVTVYGFFAHRAANKAKQIEKDIPGAKVVVPAETKMAVPALRDNPAVVSKG